MKTSSGISRRFAFIGYRTEKDAARARKYFNDTYIDTSKIIVEKSKPIGDASLPRPWSSYSAGSSANLQKLGTHRVINVQEAKSSDGKDNDKLNEAQKGEAERKKQHISKLYEDLDNPKLKEYLGVMSKKKGQTWANDDIAATKEDGPEKNRKNGKGAPKVATVAVANRKTGGTGQVLTKTHVTFDDSDDELYDNMPPSKDEDEEEDEKAEQIEDNSAVNNMSDLDYLRSKMTLKDEEPIDESELQSDEDNNEEKEEDDQESNDGGDDQSEGGDYVDEDSDKEDMDLDKQEVPVEQPKPVLNQEPPMRPPIEPEVSPIDQISDTGRLFVRNLPYTCSEDDLKKLFQKFGPLSEVHMPIAKDTKKPKGFAYILYLLPEHAIKAFETLDQQSFQGRLLHILPAKEKPQAKEESEAGPNGARLSSVKKQKESQRKAQAGSDFNWNALFMSGDAIAASIADRLGVSKADVLNPEADNQAVRLALAETQIVQETKEFFSKHGIVLDSFAKKERSDTVILVKNIPYGTSEEELRDLFGKHGDLGRVLLPPAKTIAVVEFLEPSEARAAFSALAYRRFKDTLIYLEKGPKDMFSSKYDPKAIAAAAATEAAKEGKKAITGSELVGTDNDTTDLDAVEGSTLFIKNLNFSTTAEVLKKAFSSIQGYRSSRINVKDDPKHPSKKLSMGFGFVEFDSKQNAEKAMKAMQGYNLDGHALQIKFSHRKTTASDASKPGTSKTAHGTKLIVRNVPFEATKKDIRELFGSYGQLKSLRIPKKFNGGHRGFAFLEFMTKQEAKNVFDNMSSIHLYGRHLVLEWAAEDESVDALREKTGKKFAREDHGPHGRGGKRQRVDLDHDDDAFAATEMQTDDLSD
ncbi:Multiple RNA-binding domain-containing protein 1 [Umbelopsis sp. WA50703]